MGRIMLRWPKLEVVKLIEGEIPRQSPMILVPYSLEHLNLSENNFVCLLKHHSTTEFEKHNVEL